MKARELTERVARDLADDAGIRFSEARLRGLLDEAQRTLVMLRPNANAKVESVLLKAQSTRQEVPAGAFRFLGLVRNMGTDGNTPGASITFVERSVLDSGNSMWHVAAGSAVIDHYTFVKDTPKVFYVTPPPAADVHVEMEYSAAPAVVTTLDQEIDLDANWFGVLREYMMYLAYSESATDANQRQRAEWHLQKYYLLLGEEEKASVIFAPRNKEDN